MVDRNAIVVLSRYFLVRYAVLLPFCAVKIYADSRLVRYVAMHAMQEDAALQGHEHQSSPNGYSDSNSAPARKQSRAQMRDTIATVVGMLLPLLTQLGHHSH
jgi:hypothetical protein